MQKSLEPKQKKPTGEQKRISSEVPKAECIRLCTHKPNFEWDVKTLCGKPLAEQKKALVEKLMEQKPEERENAAMALIDVCGDTNFKIASLLAMKECGVPINLGIIVQKVFNGRSYEDCIMIVEKAGAVVTQGNKEKIKGYCEMRIFDNSLYGVII